MMRLRSPRSARPIDLSQLPEAASAETALPGHEPADRPGRSRRRRHATRLAGFASALVFLGQCGGGGCAPTAVPAAPATPAAPAAPAAAPVAPGTPAPAGQQGFAPLGAQLPSDEDCAAQVRANPSPETRPLNTPYNTTPWRAHPTFFPRATGNFTGSTDDIIRWAACKWGYDVDVLRAQVAREAWGKMDGLGDWTSDPAYCLPGHGIGVDGRPGSCPQTVGLMQVKAFYYADGIEGSMRSTAYNIDVALATWRNCYDGNETWLNNHERGRQYTAGDAWGCIGRWYSGRWYTEGASWYMGELQRYRDQRIWESRDYLSDTGPSA